MIQRFLAVLDARNKEFLRDRSALAWNFLFPILVVFGFAIAFSNGSQDLFKVALFRQSQSAASSLSHSFSETRHVEFVQISDLSAAIEKLRHHQFDMIFSPEGGRYWINSTSPKGYLLEKILLGSESGSGEKYTKQTVEGRETRYVDWLISGLLAMNMMFSALFGVGYTIVRYRKNGVLKRLKATPLTSTEFLLAQVVSRLILMIFVSAVVFLGTHAVIHFQMLGSYLNLFLVLLLGCICLIALGLLVAARVSSEEFAGGVLNLISWPMMFLSGVWFSLEGAHPWVKSAAQVFPLTHVIDASRAIMTQGAGLAQVSTHLVALALMTVIFLAVGALTFKWE